jgi:hypothetical protein
MDADANAVEAEFLKPSTAILNESPCVYVEGQPIHTPQSSPLNGRTKGHCRIAQDAYKLHLQMCVHTAIVSMPMATPSQSQCNPLK